MANIALVSRCNYRCKYCFADSFMKESEKDMTLESFYKLLDFVAPDGEIGLIGGEPLLYKEIDTVLEVLDRDMRFERVTLYTNGVLIDKHIDSLCSRKLIILVNLNSQADIGKENFERTVNNIKLLYGRGMGRNITLGINVYREGQDFSDFVRVARELGVRRVRVSLVIPSDKSEGGIEYFKRMKKTLFSLYSQLKDCGICPCYDCNAIPECVYNNEEKEFLSSLPFTNSFEREIFLGKRSVCSPIIDIYPDMYATRCFGCNEDKAYVWDFKSLSDLRNYFFMKIDSKRVHALSCGECATCYKHKVFGCFGGCLCYKEIK